MDLLRDNVRAVYRKYFLAAFGSALISCIYGVVDMAMVGQYQGPDGTAVMAWAGVWLLEEPILRFFGADALAIYGPVINISTFVQCCAYSVGQAAQPIISTNSGAHQGARIRAVLRLALVSCVAFSVFWTALSLAWPNLYIRIFMRRRRRSSPWRRASSGRMPCRSCCCRPCLGRPRSGGPCQSRSCWSHAMPRRPCGARRGRCRRAKTGPVCIHSCYWG